MCWCFIHYRLFLFITVHVTQTCCKTGTKYRISLQLLRAAEVSYPFTAPNSGLSRLRSGRCGVRIPTDTKDFFSLLSNVQTDSGAHPGPHSTSTCVLPRGSSGRGLMLTTHIFLAPSLRMSGVIPLVPQYSFVTWGGTT